MSKRRDRELRTRRALRLVRRGQPKTVEEAEALGVNLRKTGQGAFRTAYRIYGTNLLIKFPLQCKYEGCCTQHKSGGGSEGHVWHDREGKNHTRMEVKKIRALLKFPMWKKHLPPVYYFNGRDGVIVTKFYPPSKRYVVDDGRNMLMGELVKVFCGVTLGDLTDDNVRVDNHLVICDLGY